MCWSYAFLREHRIVMCGAQLELTIKVIENVRRQRHLPDHSALAALECSDVCDTAFDVDRIRRERERLRDARAAPGEHMAKQALGRWKLLR